MSNRVNGRDLGPNLMLMVKRLLENQTLLKLLYYEGKNPLGEEDISDTKDFLHKYFRVVPRVGIQENSESKIAFLLTDGIIDNKNIDYHDLFLNIYIYTPLEQWLIEDVNFRPFLIMSEIQKSLIGKQFHGLGVVEGGNFHLDMITDEMSCYILTLKFTTHV